MTAEPQLDDPRAIDGYLRSLGGALRGPSRWRRRVLLEIEDGLRADLAAGVTVDELLPNWGSVSELVKEFNRCGRQARARQLGWRIVQLIIPIVFGWWLMVALSPHTWPDEPTAVSWISPLVFGSLILVVTGAALLIRPIPVARPPIGEIEPVTVICVCAGMIVCVLSTTMLFFMQLIAAKGNLFWPAVWPATALTITLLVMVAANTRQLIPRSA